VDILIVLAAHGFLSNTDSTQGEQRLACICHRQFSIFFISKHAEDAGRKPGDESVPAEGW